MLVSLEKMVLERGDLKLLNDTRCKFMQNVSWVKANQLRVKNTCQNGHIPLRLFFFLESAARYIISTFCAISVFDLVH